MLGSAQGADRPGHGRLLVRGLVAVDHALADGYVELAGGGLQERGRLLGVTGLSSLAELADRGLQRRLDRLVAQAGLLVRLDPLDLGLDVRHEGSLGLRSVGMSSERAGRTSAPHAVEQVSSERPTR